MYAQQPKLFQISNQSYNFVVTWT